MSQTDKYIIFKNKLLNIEYLLSTQIGLKVGKLSVSVIKCFLHFKMIPSMQLYNQDQYSGFTFINLYIYVNKFDFKQSYG